MELAHIGLAVLALVIMIVLHVTSPPPRRVRKVPKHLRPYDELRLTNL